MSTDIFDNDDPTQRQALIEALAAKGLEASDYNSGGGIMHVLIPLVDPYSEPSLVAAESPEVEQKVRSYFEKCPEAASLYIVTGSAMSNCDIGFIGDNGKGGQIETPKWEHADIIVEAVVIFMKLWSQRDQWLNAFIRGDLNRWHIN